MGAVRSHPLPVPADTLHSASAEPVRLGMPELCRTGLSETWLWKACGHRHWLALAAAHGLDRPDFRDPDGNRLYPAFTDVRLEQGRLDIAREHDLLDFSVELRRIGRTRFRSRITVRMGETIIAILVMESTFVRRAVAGSNRSATRGLVARPSWLLPPTIAEAPFRIASWTEAAGFHSGERAELEILTLDPNPHEDFNGADFLYFAAFQAILDRAEWTWFRRVDPLLNTKTRRIIYAGNAELGDRVIAKLCGVRCPNHELATWIELARESDDATIAVAFTFKMPRPRTGVSA